MTVGKVLVLGSDTRSFLAVLRSLGRAGLEVHTGWAPPNDPALRSRFIARRHELAAPPMRGWADQLHEVLKKEKFTLVLPTNDPAILALKGERTRFEKLARIYLLNDRAQRIASSKILTHQLALRLRIPVAPARQLNQVGEVTSEILSMPLPLVLKPRESFREGASGRRRNVIKIYERDRLMPAIEEMLSDGPLLIEENFVGVGIGLEVLCRAGRVLTCFAHERVHEPLHGGGSSYRKSMKPPSEMLAAVRNIAEDTEYDGLGMFEFKLNRSTGQWILIEINPRFWGSLPLAISCGADFPLFLYEMLIGGRHRFPESYPEGRYCRHPRLDLEWMQANWGADKSDSTLCAEPWSRVLAEFTNLLLGRERLDTLTLDDPLPGLTDLGQWFAEKAGRISLRLRSKAMNSSVLRRRRHARAAAALKTCRSILFVCYGNICRSPFAEALCRAALPELVTASAGFYQKEGRESPRRAQEAAMEFGVDIAPHRSKLVVAEMVEPADLIFVFDEQNLRNFKEAFPSALRKVHCLGELNTAGPLFIDDPYGRSREGFRTIFRQIANAVEVLRQSVDLPC